MGCGHDQPHGEAMQARPDDLLPVRSVAFVMTAVLGAFMAFLALRAAIDPLGAATGFGSSLAAASDAFYLHVKADRDLAIAAAILGLLAYRGATPLAILVAAMLIAPICDALLVMREGRLGYALAVHGSAVAYGVVLVWQLRARARDRSARA
jgi:ABC-type xylose transport system permease subunit